MKKKLGYLGVSILFSVVIILFISFIQMFFFKNEYPFIYKPALVLSGSMEPKISVDDLAIVKKATDLKVGDVVLYNDENGKKVMHRIIDISNDTITTRGDANNVNDSPIKYSDITGIYVGKIKYVGKIIKMIKSPIGLVTTFAIILCIYFIPNKRKENKENNITKKENEIETEITKTKENKIGKYIIEGSLYIILLVVCIISGYYSRYVEQITGGDTVAVAKWGNDLSITTSDEVVFKNNQNNSTTIPVKVKSTSEVASRYDIVVENLIPEYKVTLSSDSYSLLFSIVGDKLTINYYGTNIEFNTNNTNEDNNNYHMNKFTNDNKTYYSIIDNITGKELVQISKDADNKVGIIYRNLGEFLIGESMAKDYSLNITTNSNTLPGETGINISAIFEQID